jgi:type IV pilus assembly protein PilV
MVERIKANSANAVTCAGERLHGTGHRQPTDCTDSTDTQAKRDICEWSNALKGASESSSGTKVGAMIGARGCVQQITAPDPTSGICQPGTYRVSAAWQGLFATSAPALSCGSGQYGSNEAVRRAISSDIVIGLPSCI